MPYFIFSRKKKSITIRLEFLRITVVLKIVASEKVIFNNSKKKVGFHKI